MEFIDGITLATAAGERTAFTSGRPRDRVAISLRPGGHPSRGTGPPGLQAGERDDHARRPRSGDGLRAGASPDRRTDADDLRDPGIHGARSKRVGDRIGRASRRVCRRDGARGDAGRRRRGEPRIPQSALAQWHARSRRGVPDGPWASGPATGPRVEPAGSLCLGAGPGPGARGSDASSPRLRGEASVSRSGFVHGGGRGVLLRPRSRG